MKWSLADKWKGMAEQSLACGIDGCAMPTWSSPKINWSEEKDTLAQPTGAMREPPSEDLVA